MTPEEPGEFAAFGLRLYRALGREPSHEEVRKGFRALGGNEWDDARLELDLRGPRHTYASLRSYLRKSTPDKPVQHPGIRGGHGYWLNGLWHYGVRRFADRTGWGERHEIPSLYPPPAWDDEIAPYVQQFLYGRGVRPGHEGDALMHLTRGARDDLAMHIARETGLSLEGALEHLFDLRESMRPEGHVLIPSDEEMPDVSERKEMFGVKPDPPRPSHRISRWDVQSFLIHVENAPPDVTEAGLDWYDGEAYGVALDLANRSPYTLEQCVAVLAAYSPKTPWRADPQRLYFRRSGGQDNVTLATNAILYGKFGGMEGNPDKDGVKNGPKMKAMRILEYPGKPVVLYGPNSSLGGAFKTKFFFRNIIGQHTALELPDDNTSVTVDVHVSNILSLPVGDDHYYDYARQVVITGARLLNLRPKDAQAIAWEYYRRHRAVMIEETGFHMRSNTPEWQEYVRTVHPAAEGNAMILRADRDAKSAKTRERKARAGASQEQEMLEGEIVPERAPKATMVEKSLRAWLRGR